MNERQRVKLRSIYDVVILLRLKKFKDRQIQLLQRDLEHSLALAQRLEGDQLTESKMREEHTDRVARARRILRDVYMYPISRRGPALMKWAPQAELALRLPHETVGNARLLASARAMAKVVALKPSLFVEAGFEKGLLVAFRAAIRKLELEIAGSRRNTRELTRLTAELEPAISRARAQGRQMDGLLRPYIFSHASFGIEWRQAWLIPGRLGRPKKKKKAKKPPPHDE
jgi:hypothetical protein